MKKFFKRLGIALLVLAAAAAALHLISKSRSFQFFGEIADRVETSEKAVALTFDDGPSLVNTEILLDLLSRYQAKATFFVLGYQAKAHPLTLQRILKDGHQIANHSYSHPRMLFVSPSRARFEIETTNDAIRDSGYRDEIVFRPPYGKKLFTLPYALSRLGMKTIMWDVDSRDTETQEYDEIRRNVIPNVRPGSIVIFHDGGKEKLGTREIVEETLRDFSAQGYRFVTVNELLKLRK